MDSGVGEPEALLVETMSGFVFIPESRDRNTSEPCADDSPGSVYRHKSNHAPACNAHARRRENPQVLEENGQLRQNEGAIIDWDSCPEALSTRAK